MEDVHEGSCFCGQLSYKVVGKPILSAYCHCTGCQRLDAAAFIHTIHFPYSAFSWTHGPEVVPDIYSVADKPWKNRYRCRNCGAPVASHNVKVDKWSVWGAQFARDESGTIKGWDSIAPTAHIFYDTRMLDIQDNLGKWDGYENQSNRIA